MLLICNDQGKVCVFDFFLDQRMRTDDDRSFSGSNALVGDAFFFCRIRTGQKNGRKRKSLFFHQFQKAFVMLPCKDFCRGHQCRLITIVCHKKHREKCEDRLAASNVPLYKPGHHRSSGEVAFDLMPGIELCICK